MVSKVLLTYLLSFQQKKFVTKSSPPSKLCYSKWSSATCFYPIHKAVLDTEWIQTLKNIPKTFQEHNFRKTMLFQIIEKNVTLPYAR